MKTADIKRVVVRGTNWVGDAVMTIPALRELRRVLPDAEITLCTRSWAEGIFADADFLDAILIFDKDKNRLSNFWQQAKIWRERKFDLAILLNNAFESALLARIGSASMRIGYQTEARSFLLTDAVKVPAWKNERHEVYYYLNLIAELETKLGGQTIVRQNEPDSTLTISAARQIAARDLLRQNGVDLTKPVIAFCPGSTNSRAKRWQTESYAELADLIKEKLNAEIVLVGAPDEMEVSQTILAQAESKPILLTGKTTLAQLTAILSVVDCLVSNDTGPAHIAPALGTQTVVIFGPTDPRTTRPFGENAQIVYQPPTCAPCLLRDCPIDHRCLTIIKPLEVLDLVRKIISGARLKN